MNDKLLKIVLRIAVVFLILSVAFCVFAVVRTNKQKYEMEQQRLENETKLAQLQLPPTQKPATPPPAEAAVLNTGAEDTKTEPSVTSEKKIIVIDPGHGKSSSQMSADEKISEGFEYNESRGGWGEWRHYKNNTFGEDCNGSGCTEICPQNGSCWYSMGEADRNTEPEINLNNALAAKEYLEQMGYEVRMTRTTNDTNPSMNKRVSYCFPDNDITQQPDASAYICIHANAGGGSGSAYISLSEPYKQKFITDSYVSESNRMGQLINSKVTAATGLKQLSPINQPYLILFNKCPIPIAYMEIGFYDNSSDKAIIQSSADAIGKAIAEGVDEYFTDNQ